MEMNPNNFTHPIDNSDEANHHPITDPTPTTQTHVKSSPNNTDLSLTPHINDYSWSFESCDLSPNQTEVSTVLSQTSSNSQTPQLDNIPNQNAELNQNVDHSYPKPHHWCSDVHIWLGLGFFIVSILTLLIFINLVKMSQPMKHISTIMLSNNNLPKSPMLISLFGVASILELISSVYLIATPFIPLTKFHNTKNNDVVDGVRTQYKKRRIMAKLSIVVIAIVIQMAHIAFASWSLNDFLTTRIPISKQQPELWRHEEFPQAHEHHTIGQTTLILSRMMSTQEFTIPRGIDPEKPRSSSITNVPKEKIDATNASKRANGSNDNPAKKKERSFFVFPNAPYPQSTPPIFAGLYMALSSLCLLGAGFALAQTIREALRLKS